MKTKTAFLLVLMFLIATNVSPQKKNNKILFMEFKYVNGTPELIALKVANGKLKTKTNNGTANNELYFETRTKENEVLYKNVMKYPSKTVYEYPAENGKISRVEVKHESTGFVLRVPYTTNIDRLIIYKGSPENVLLKTIQDSNSPKFEFPINHNLVRKD